MSPLTTRDPCQLALSSERYSGASPQIPGSMPWSAPERLLGTLLQWIPV